MTSAGYRIFTLVLVVSSIWLSACSRTNPDVALRRAYDVAMGDGQGSGQKTTHFEAALTLLEDAVELDDPSAEALEFQLICLVRLGRTDEALEVCTRLQNLNGESFILNYLAGKIYYDRGNYKTALAFLEKAHKARPDDENTNLLRAVAATRSDYPDAGTYMEQLLAMTAFKQESDLYNEWAMWLLRNGKPLPALSVLTQGTAVQNPNIALYRNIAVIQDAELKRPEPAWRFYKIYQEVGVGHISEDELKKVQQRQRQIASR